MEQHISIVLYSGRDLLFSEMWKDHCKGRKGKRVYSNNSPFQQKAVFSWSSLLKGNWWQPLVASRVGNTFALLILSMISSISDRGYLSFRVTWLRGRKSTHIRTSSSFFFTGTILEHQELFELFLVPFVLQFLYRLPLLSVLEFGVSSRDQLTITRIDGVLSECAWPVGIEIISEKIIIFCQYFFLCFDINLVYISAWDRLIFLDDVSQQVWVFYYILTAKYCYLWISSCDVRTNYLTARSYLYLQVL